MNSSLTLTSLASLRKSYFNVLAFYMLDENSCADKLSCLLKWGAELEISKSELLRLMKNPSLLPYQSPESTIDALAQIYDLVYMVYMDGIVEDVELAVVTEYAAQLGLEPCTVNALLKALVAAQLDGVTNEALRSDIIVHPEVYVEA
ncbi:hypothetical protein [Cesiribacter andamanensis]|uniref:Tellurite resistance protein TerB n=1 Tax=Cesiribacter andamanensis AMV16 TaxID=1279009 RepID=M7N545_9BACT|nr:hypothetical protein [Cesiribacter andamanensis]EMR02417.1 hypothetical protein ADICEAN_02460 [Cesiribacter andamanensis AMV16]